MSSKLRNKLNKALEMEQGFVESITKTTMENLIVKTKVLELCNSDECYEIIRQNKKRGEEYTRLILKKS